MVGCPGFDSIADHHRRVAAELYRKTKLGPPDIDGLGFTVPLSEAGNPFWSNYCSDYLGISPRWLQTSDLGGASAADHSGQHPHPAAQRLLVRHRKREAQAGRRATKGGPHEKSAHGEIDPDR